MIALGTVFVVALVSLLITRIATMVLALTGMSHEAARFQARSALSGVGFTTTEAEQVVNHPVRRRVVLTLMLVGSAGLVTAVATVMLSFVNASQAEAERRLLILGGGLLLLLLLARSPWFDRRLSAAIGWALERFTDFGAHDYAKLLHLGGDFAVMEVGVRPGDWIADRTLAQLRLRDEGVAVLGIERPDGTYLGAPPWSTRITTRDTVVVYGPEHLIRDVDCRQAGPEGDRAHAAAVEAQRRRLDEAGAELADAD